jgi:hypothetical protein
LCGSPQLVYPRYSYGSSVRQHQDTFLAGWAVAPRATGTDRTSWRPQVETPAFQRVREALARRYRNANMRPEQAANYARLYALRAAMWHVDAVLPHVEAATPADVQAGFLRGLGPLSNLNCKGSAYNWGK